MSEFQLGRANPKVVGELMKHLVGAFEKFADKKAEETERGLEYIDALMGCHNFYKAIILDLERRIAEESPMVGKTSILRRTAIDTLSLALGIPK